jgi:hypothetical protein
VYAILVDGLAILDGVVLLNHYERPCILATMFSQHPQQVESMSLGHGWIEFFGLLA